MLRNKSWNRKIWIKITTWKKSYDCTSYKSKNWKWKKVIYHWFRTISSKPIKPETRWLGPQSKSRSLLYCDQNWLTTKSFDDSKIGWQQLVRFPKPLYEVSWRTVTSPLHLNQWSLKIVDWVNDPKAEAFYIFIKIGWQQKKLTTAKTCSWNQKM